MPLISYFPVAGGFVALINVSFSEGATLTCAKGGISYTETPAGTSYTFKVFDAGTWTITATNGAQNRSDTVDITHDKQYAEVFVGFVHIYGIQRDVTNSSPQWTRTNEAVGLTATATSGATSGASDFSALYPWSEMQRETLATGDVMVRIPKFWFKRYRDGNIEHIELCDQAYTGYTLHPVFSRDNAEKEAVYVGAYKTGNGNKSLSGVSPTVQITRASARTSARNKGDGWGIVDVDAMSAIQMLMLVEFANNDLQTAVGYGYCNNNSNFRTTGSCDSVSGLTGVPSGSTGKVDVVYRGIEGFWGNVWEWLDGLNTNNGTYYVSSTPAAYADDTANGYQALSFVGQTNWSGAWISQIGLDPSHSHILLPSAAQADGNGQTYFCDVAQMAGGWKVVQRGAAWDQGLAAGPFGMEILNASNSAYTSIGSRLLYIP